MGPPRKILLVVTVGGFTHAAPILEVGKILASRGHTVDFATLDGQDNWIQDYPYISQLHLLGPGPSSSEMDAHYRRMLSWNPAKGISDVMRSKYLFDSYWPATYRGLRAIFDDPVTRPDMVFGDFFVDAVKDMRICYGVPVAMMWPNMPYLMVPCSYIPGQPGFQLEQTLTSETASLMSRVRNELVLVWALPELLKLMHWTKKMRRDAGVYYTLPIQKKPDYLLLVNSFFGLEVPKDLPPLVAAIGPILSDTYPPLDPTHETFLAVHEKVLYIALGTHIILPHATFLRILSGLAASLAAKSIDGVIWAVGRSARQDWDVSDTVTLAGTTLPVADLLSGAHRAFTFPLFAPQRAILTHPHCRVYMTHGGGSSANEGLYHGVPMLALPIYFDQLGNAAKLVASGTTLPLDKDTFTPSTIAAHLSALVTDPGGKFALNCTRMRRIAEVAARRKHLAADLVEEVLYDEEGRAEEKAGRSMHLQTADVRMPAWKAGNWDLVALAGLVGIGAVGIAMVAGTVVWEQSRGWVGDVWKGWVG